LPFLARNPGAKGGLFLLKEFGEVGIMISLLIFVGDLRYVD